MPFILAQTSTTPPPPHGIWYPTILGILVVLAGILLFCGSIYLLLATNLGARLGFLVAFTGLTGFMVVLTLLWMTTSATGALDTLKGSLPAWQVVAVVKNPKDAKGLPSEVREIATTGHAMPVATQQLVKAAADARLVVAQPIANIPLAPDQNKFAVFQATTDYQETSYRLVGGSTPHLVSWQLNHQPLYAVVGYCALTPDNLPFGLPPPKPTCDTVNPKTGFVVLRYDYGSLRIPPFVAFLCASILFTLGLLALHWREKDERAAKARAEAAEQQSEVPASRTPEPVGS